MKKLMILMVAAALVLFCWGWVSNVLHGKMTTGQYLDKIRLDYRKFQLDLQEKIMGDTERMIDTKKQVAGDLRKWGRLPLPETSSGTVPGTGDET